MMNALTTADKHNIIDRIYAQINEVNNNQFSDSNPSKKVFMKSLPNNEKLNDFLMTIYPCGDYLGFENTNINKSILQIDFKLEAYNKASMDDNLKLFVNVTGVDTYAFDDSGYFRIITGYQTIIPTTDVLYRTNTDFDIKTYTLPNDASVNDFISIVNHFKDNARYKLDNDDSLYVRIPYDQRVIKKPRLKRIYAKV